MLQLNNLNIGYKGKNSNKEVFKNLHVNIEKGILVALAGNNGTGKSTLIKTISGVIKPLSGNVVIDGKDLASCRVEEISKTISVVLTDKVGGFNLTVFDVVASGRIPYVNALGQLLNKDVEIVEACMETVGVHQLRNELFEELSDGQRQKVLIAKSLAQQTPVILMDEPTAFLDYNSRKKLFELLVQLTQKENKTIIISSHDLDILFKHAHKTLFLRDDKSYFFGETALIKDEILK